MELAIVIFMFFLGVVLTVKGGDYFVDAASWIAEASGIPKLIVGATIVSVATTLPELIVSVMAAAEGKVDMSIGNAVGSVNANIGLIMAIALIFMPKEIKRRDYLKKALIFFAASGILVACGFLGDVSVIFSGVLIALFAIYMLDNINQARIVRKERGDEGKDPALKDKKTITTNIVKFVVGVTGIVLGAQLLVNYGSELARIFGVSDRIIGITLVAVGTSLPELITTITAIRKKQASLSLGNVIGANIIDLTLIMPISSVATGKALPIAAAAAHIDIPACLLLGLVALLPSLVTKKFQRWQGAVLLVLYVVYIVFSCIA